MSAANGPPWELLIANLDDDTSRSTALQVVTSLLREDGRTAERIALIMPHVSLLKSPAGRDAIYNELVNHLEATPELNETFLTLTFDEVETLRQLGARALLQMVNYPRARSRLYELLTDVSPNMREIAIQAFPTLVNSTPSEAEGTQALRVIPDPDASTEAIELIDQLDRALKTLQELSPDDAQDRILDKIVFPALVRLRSLISGASADVAELQSNRKDGILTMGTLNGAARAALHAAPATVALLANGDEAAMNVVHGIEALLPYAEMMASLLTKPF